MSMKNPSPAEADAHNEEIRKSNVAAANIAAMICGKTDACYISRQQLYNVIAKLCNDMNKAQSLYSQAIVDLYCSNSGHPMFDIFSKESIDSYWAERMRRLELAGCRTVVR